MHKRTFLRRAIAGALTTVSPLSRTQTAQRYRLAGSDANGRPLTLDDYAGKVCLVSFFTSACNLCGNDLKLMREFYLDNKTRNFILIGVDMDDSKEDFVEYARLISLSVPPAQRFPIVWRNAPRHRDSFGSISKRPTHFVLDRQHRLVLRREGIFRPGDWDDLWASLA